MSNLAAMTYLRNTVYIVLLEINFILFAVNWKTTKFNKIDCCFIYKTCLAERVSIML